MARPDLRALTRRLVAASAEHRLFTYSAALAFQALATLVPLTMLGLGILGATGLEDTWRDSVAPVIEERVTEPVFAAIDFSVKRLLAERTIGLIALSLLLVLWYLSLCVRTVMEALNTIHDVHDRRPWRPRLLVTVGLAVALGVCLVGSALVVTVAPVVASGVLDPLLTLARWLAAVGLLAVAVGLLMRYAPAERPEVRWASAGSVLVIVVWVVASFLFRLYVSTVADFKSPIGTLTVFLVLTGYVFTTAAIFLTGAQLDELLRKDARRGGRAS